MPEREAWADFAAGDRVCSFCGHPCLPEDHPATSKDGGHYAHFTCWYDGAAIPPIRYADAPSRGVGYDVGYDAAVSRVLEILRQLDPVTRAWTSDGKDLRMPWTGPDIARYVADALSAEGT